MPADRPSAEVEAAVAEVLAAGRGALAAIGAARREGGGSPLGALAQARRIAERGEQRLARLREAAARRIRQQTEEVEAEIARLAAAAIDSPADEAAIAAAVAAVAAELGGAQTTVASHPHPLPRQGGRRADP